MIYIHSMDRAVRNYPERPALLVGNESLNFRELHNRVKSIAGALSQRDYRKAGRARCSSGSCVSSFGLERSVLSGRNLWRALQHPLTSLHSTKAFEESAGSFSDSDPSTSGNSDNAS
jgi:hypothetical protein